MPRTLNWREVGLALDATGVDALLEGFKRHTTTKSNLMACSVCCCGAQHFLSYKLFKCESSTCSDLTCSWRAMVLVCQETQDTYVYELGDHCTQATSPKRLKLSSQQKDFCRGLSQQRIRPLRIQHALVRRFDLNTNEVPPLDKVQNFCNYYSRTELDNYDRIEDLTRWIQDRAFTGDEDENKPFTFAWHLDEHGKLFVGNGSDEEPFIVGLSTKAMIRRLELPSESYILHMDATFKMNTSDYPVFVVGISDRCRSFHLVAMFVVSQRTQPIYEACLGSVRNLYTRVTNKTPSIRYVMGDAEQAQFNAVAAVFGQDSDFKYLMCFFHVLTNVQKKIEGFPSHVSAAVTRGLYDLHFARSEVEYLRKRDHLLTTWRGYPSLREFCDYLEKLWLTGDFKYWQCYLTLFGFATTDNPVEQFNKILKRDYTMWRRLKMGSLLNELFDCCRHESTSNRPFRTTVEATDALARRMAELVREKLILRNELVEIMSADPGVMHILAYAAKRVIVQGTKRSTEEEIAVSAQMGVNYARMEVQNQPPTGWPVQVRARWCPCSYWFKFGTCVHVLYALRLSDRVDGSGRRILVSRRVTGKRALTLWRATTKPRARIDFGLIQHFDTAPDHSEMYMYSL